MVPIHLLLIVLAFVMALLATFEVPARINWIGAALAFWFLDMLISGAPLLVR